MALSALSSTYQQYKADTKSVAVWLASNGKGLGFDAITPPDNAVGGSKGGRLKGKARVEAKKQAAAQPYVISVKTFVPLAQHIATKIKSVPDWVGITLDRAIAVRSRFGKKLEQNGSVLCEVSNSTHQHFVKVLEQVREILMPLMPAREVKETISIDTNDNDDNEERNRFSSLTFYEPSQEFLDAPTPQRPAKAQVENIRYEVEAETSLESALFALATTIHDMGRVRVRIQSIWSDYKAEKIDLVSAAIATNTAIDLVRHMTEDILPLMDQHGGIKSMLNKQFDTDNDPTYVLIYTWLDALHTELRNHNRISPGTVPKLLEDDMRNVYDPGSHHWLKPEGEQLLEDWKLLGVFFTELVTVVRGGHDWPVKDEFLRGVEKQVLDQTKDVPLYVVFAARVFLDVTYELGEDIQTPFKTLICHVTQIYNDISLHLRLHIDEKASPEQFYKKLQAIIQFVHEYPCQKRTRLYSERPKSQSHRLFRMSPVSCGLFLYHIYLDYHNVGWAVVNGTASIQCGQHLYNAVRQEQLLTSDWPDMDTITANLGNDSFYVGGEKPRTPTEYYAKFGMQMGMSVVLASKSNRAIRDNVPRMSKNGCRLLKPSSPILTMFDKRYSYGSSRVDLTPEYVSQMIELSLARGDDAEDSALVLPATPQPEVTPKVGKKKIGGQAKSQKRGKAVKAKAKSRTMPIDQLIERLAPALHAEMPEFTYPYLSMHRACILLLRAVRDKCHPILSKLFPEDLNSQQAQHRTITVYRIFDATCDETYKSEREPLKTASEALSAFLNSEDCQYMIWGIPALEPTTTDSLD
ncbi:hypothetical protein F4777DRAFT_597573 [Nemania sp. FL0916]|nr:hypothetical protein F4777DRAFT_597573 [Nemania sp. FL0916]